jgi:hypothetical protein
MKHLTGLIILALLVTLYSCNDDGDSSVLDDTCMQCHSTQVKQDIEFQFNQSAHRAGAIAVDYAGGRSSCAQCHSHEGFVEYAATGDVAENITLPSAWQCKTCHNIHKTFEKDDYALRLADPVALIADEAITVDMENSNLCANCHQSRRNEPNVTNPGSEFEITSTHYGPHHGSQINLLYGVTFAEIAGSASYPAEGSHPHSALGCTGCHMSEYGEGEGGHTFNPSVASCQECHSGADDFDVGGGQTEVAELLEELRDALIAAEVLEWVEEDEAYEPIVGVHSMAEAQAFFNWIGIEEDRSHGVHNPTYIKALLENSIEALMP